MPGAKVAPARLIETRIRSIRGLKVMLDSDLAKLYGVETKRLNESVRRNRSRFPNDFMFRLTLQEHESLRSQIATSSLDDWGGRRYLPYAFTEHGVAMLSSVLNSKRAINTNIAIMRTFVQVRNFSVDYDDLRQRMEELESRQDEQAQQLQSVFDAFGQAPDPPASLPKRRIGFSTDVRR